MKNKNLQLIIIGAIALAGIGIVAGLLSGFPNKEYTIYLFIALTLATLGYNIFKLANKTERSLLNMTFYSTSLISLVLIASILTLSQFDLFTATKNILLVLTIVNAGNLIYRIK